MMSKIYGVYLAFSKYELMGEEECRDATIPSYPPELAKYVVCESKAQQLDVYANVRCAASQFVDATDMDDFNSKIVLLKHDFLDEEWLEVHIYPYI
jgi:hypothetical protein